ncbi:MAG: hypothetical protein R2728_05050 [Chitinophagales bacterium]
MTSDGLRVVTVVTKLSQPEALVKVSVTIPTANGSQVVAVAPVLS